MADHQPWLIVGLGNPGREYSKTRHNFGWMVLDAFLQDCVRRKLPGSHPAWKEEGGAYYAMFSWHEEKVVLLKPAAYMNRSGEAVGRFAGFYKTPIARIVVVHDEVDIPFSAVRIKQGGGEGGHNGLRSITGSLSSREYVRVRLGVGRPPPEAHYLEVSEWVLSRFATEEERELEAIIPRAVESIWTILESGVGVAQNRFN
ncbi:MAG: aminoacyl-tRNA hydrolase [Deltaproteobacteria bacterium]|nr:aminoacyl-tRNA hydrolase [Deltaproteobacteria bacterium]